MHSYYNSKQAYFFDPPCTAYSDVGHAAITCLSFSLQQLVKDIFGIQPPELQPQLKHVSLTRQFAIQLGNSIISPIRIVQYEHFVVSED